MTSHLCVDRLRTSFIDVGFQLLDHSLPRSLTGLPKQPIAGDHVNHFPAVAHQHILHSFDYCYSCNHSSSWVSWVSLQLDSERTRITTAVCCSATITSWIWDYKNIPQRLFLLPVFSIQKSNSPPAEAKQFKIQHSNPSCAPNNISSVRIWTKLLEPRTKIWLRAEAIHLYSTKWVLILHSLSGLEADPNPHFCSNSIRGRKNYAPKFWPRTSK